jgi:hypothetical protein
LAIHQKINLVAVVVERHLGLVNLSRVPEPNLLEIRWEKELPFPIGWIRFHPSGNRIYAGGSSTPLSDVNFDDWDSIKGGGLVCLDIEAGKLLFETTFDMPIAWGYGSVPLSMDAKGTCIFGVDRAAGLHRVDGNDGSVTQIYAAHPQGQGSFGLAHLARCGNILFCGFNRGGHRLFVYRTG